LNKRDNITVKHERSRGILNVRNPETVCGLSRYRPSADLRPFVEHYWIVRWDLREPRIAETLPHPSVHLVLESPKRAKIWGVMRAKFSRVLKGRGRVVGTKFRPGGFRPFAKQPISAFTDRQLSLREVFGNRSQGLVAQVLGQSDDVASIAMVESFLRGVRASPDERMELAGRVTTRITDDRSITTVEQLVGEFQMSLRQLQRLFNEYVGVSPKWVIQRYRLHDAAERIAAGTDIKWADLSSDLGYADQAHFIRDFRRLVGRSPAEYARSVR
jgi:AraC-like DNA-binding protein